MGQYAFLRKLLTVLFTFAVFVALFVMNSLRIINVKFNVITFIGLMLMVIFVYLELLTIRDHLWVLEGSLAEAKKWRDTFFTKKSLRTQRIRKFMVMVFSALIFTFIYYRLHYTEVFTFLGTILMVTVLYFEVLSIRDDVQEVMFELKAKKIEEITRSELMIKLQQKSSSEPDHIDMKED
ncbi:MAG: hypothetical protein HQM10_00845 [Candidatus Riflebacteria bacterium]|nr:hypothetical protein [Candidatus Riflebacteria bacterium]